MHKTLYHWSLNNFEYFNSSFLWTNINDLLSNIGFHFTDDYKLAMNLFWYDTNGSRQWYLYHIDIIEDNNYIEYTESELIKNILKFGVDTKLINKSYYNSIINLPYWDNYWNDSIIKKLYNNWKRTTSKNFINKKELANRFKENLLNKWIHIIKYKNEIEWSSDNRFDYIILKDSDINIIKKELI